MSLENGYQAYKIKPSQKFQRSFGVLKKRHYKGKKSQETFTNFIARMVKSLSDNPFLLGSESESLPKNLPLRENLEF